MKHISTLLLSGALFATGLTLQAAERSVEQMRAEAQQILQKKGYFRAPATGAAPAIQLLAGGREMSVFGYSDGAYAFVSHNDRLPAVLAYGDAQYEAVMSNPSFAHYMSTLDAYLTDCEEKGVEPKFINKKANFNPEGVKEIMKCRWDQGSPYNLMCPFVYKADKDGNLADRRCITGCVATAMAMVLYTLHQQQGADIRLRGSKYYYYIDDEKHLAFETANLGGIKLDWDNMLDTYSSTTGHVQNMAVARLMYACGVASEMNYSTGASGTYTSTAHEGLETFFEGIKDEYTGYDISGYEQRFYDELDAGRPIILSGANSDGGHCFVGDGYDKQGRIHLNLGWSGGGNTYTVIADMGGFVNGQTANFVSPKENDGLSLSKDAPLPQLEGKYITADAFHPAEELKEGEWYVLYNKGRYSSVYSTGLGKTIQNSNYIPSGDPASVVAPMIVRFIKNGTGYNIQTGTGDYFGALDYGSNKGSEKNPSFVYTTGKIQQQKAKKYFWFKQNGMTLDCNAPGGKGLAGWGSDTPTDTLGHACWMLLPVTVSDSPELPTYNPGRFDPEHRYVLVNYDGAKNYYFNLKATCSIAPKNPTELRFTPANGGWTISSYADESVVLTAKSKDFKMGNGSVAGETPLTFQFEAVDEEPYTGDENVDACSAIYRIRCENGFVGTQKIALGGTVYVDLGWHALYNRWLVIDQTAYDEMVLDGVQPALNATDTAAPAAIYDLQGRRVAVPQSGRLYIENGKTVLRK